MELFLSTTAAYDRNELLRAENALIETLQLMLKF